MKVQKNFDSKIFKKGQTIFSVDEPTDTLYLIQSGKVAIQTREGLQVATLDAGEMFGELGFKRRIEAHGVGGDGNRMRDQCNLCRCHAAESRRCRRCFARAYSQSDRPSGRSQ